MTKRILVRYLLFTGFFLFQAIRGTGFSQESQGGFRNYLKPAEINEYLVSVGSRYPGNTSLVRLCTTPGGQALNVLEISAVKGKKMPAVMVVANMDGCYPLSSLGALHLANLILGDAANYADRNWYILPVGNPDAALRYFSKPLYLDQRNSLAYNDDLDDLQDEDGYNDLNGDGIITQMRVKHPEGEWISVKGDPRIMKKADNSKGERGVYKLYTEGLDDDGDGQYNEDGPGGVNVNLNFPHLFKPWQPDGGLWPGSTPEVFSIMKYVYGHPEIAMALAFGGSDFCLTPPRGGRRSSVDMEKIKVPERYARIFGVDPEKTYTMAEIMEQVKPMLPAGMEVSESMIAGILGLGAVVNPMSEDLKFYTELSEKYKEYLKEKKFDTPRLAAEPDKDGSFELWAYYHLGVPSFGMNLWTLPEVKEEKKETSGITLEKIEKMSNEEFLALGEEKIAAFMKESGAPPQYKPEMVINMVKSGQVQLRQLAAMMKNMPKPPDTSEGDPKTRALLKFSDEKLGGRGFLPWKSCNHPVLGEVEIGGAVPFADNTPPAHMIDSLLLVQVPWALSLARQLPVLSIAGTKLSALGGGIYELEVWIANNGLISFPTAMGERNRQPAPAVVLLEGQGFDILSGYKRTPLNRLNGYKTQKLKWLIQADKPVDLTLKLNSENAYNDQKIIKLGGVK